MARLGIFIVWLLHFLPLPLLAAIGNGVGLLLYLMAEERRQVTKINLRLCFPEMTERARAGLARRNFMAFGRGFLERGILWWSSLARINRLVRPLGIENLEAELGKPIILLTAHFVALDVGGAWLSQRLNAVSVYGSQKDPLIHKMLLEKRQRFGDQLLFSRQQGMRPVVRALRGGRPLFYFTDQDFGAKDALFIPFFGILASTLTTLPRLVEMTGARVVPCITRMLPWGRGYEVHLYPAWENYPTGDLAADTRRMNEFIEQRVREMPEQYFWPHKRFKTRPPGEERPYG
ncbi:MAG: lipid A biosynthesis acyltransferase [Pseudomonadota bacterium]